MVCLITPKLVKLLEARWALTMFRKSLIKTDLNLYTTFQTVGKAANPAPPPLQKRGKFLSTRIYLVISWFKMANFNLF